MTMSGNFNPFNPTQFNQSTFGTAGNPGFLSPFDLNAALTGATTSAADMQTQYQNLGLGQTAASPSGPNTPFKGGGGTSGGGGASGNWSPGPGSGTTPTTPGSFGAGSTPFQQEIGQKPSLTGGIPEQFQALLGQQQTADLGQTTTSALAALQGKNAQTGLIGGGLGALGKIL